MHLPDSWYTLDKSCACWTATCWLYYKFARQLIPVGSTLHLSDSWYLLDLPDTCQTVYTCWIYHTFAGQLIPVGSTLHLPDSWYLLDLPCACWTSDTCLIKHAPHNYYMPDLTGQTAVTCQILLAILTGSNVPAIHWIHTRSNLHPLDN